MERGRDRGARQGRAAESVLAKDPLHPYVALGQLVPSLAPVPAQSSFLRCMGNCKPAHHAALPDLRGFPRLQMGLWFNEGEKYEIK